jgi:hypothetical protein
MKEFSNENHACSKHRLDLWYCAGCRMVHLRAGEAVLSFDGREFAEFANAVVDIHYSSGWQMSQWVMSASEENETDEILESQMIA